MAQYNTGKFDKFLWPFVLVTVLTGFYCNQLCFQYCTGAGRIESDHQDKPSFPGALNSCYTEKLEFDDPDDGGVIPVYRVMDRNGKVFEEALDPKVFISLFSPF